jgi:hypothetical protein
MPWYTAIYFMAAFHGAHLAFTCFVGRVPALNGSRPEIVWGRLDRPICGGIINILIKTDPIVPI